MEGRALGWDEPMAQRNSRAVGGPDTITLAKQRTEKRRRRRHEMAQRLQSLVEEHPDADRFDVYGRAALTAYGELDTDQDFRTLTENVEPISQFWPDDVEDEGAREYTAMKLVEDQTDFGPTISIVARTDVDNPRFPR